MSLPPGVKLNNRYHVIRLVSQEGGMALVYEVVDTRDSPPSTWALKELRDPPKPGEEAERLHLFDQEAKMLERFDHANIPRFRERFDDRGKAYLALEFIPGEPLDKILSYRGGPLDESDVLKWSIQLCQVLDYLHNLIPKVIYRDLKPGNIMITHDGIVKIIDFGIARTHKGSKRRDTVLMGTEAYAAPELYGGKGESAPDTDIYSLSNAT